ncbi:MAG TPA: hypothetical protein PKE16_01200 [Hyphomicrobium sp.]|nr:hypothetical protein [Hyphomicrobium sp.]
MTVKLSLVAAAVAAGLLFASPSGMATTAGSLGTLKGVGAAQSNVEKTHGWHRTCRRGLNGYHRHVPGVGRIQCTARKCWTNSWGVRRCRWF